MASVDDVSGGVSTGTPGSKRSRARRIARNSSVSIEDSVARVSVPWGSKRSPGSPAAFASAARNACGSSPGRRRQSRVADASPGITFTLSLPFRPVTAIVARRHAARKESARSTARSFGSRSA